MSVPKDKHNLIYILFIMNSMGVWWPWLATIEIFAYLKKEENLKDKVNIDFWQFALGISSLGPRIIFMFINMFLPKSCGRLSSRILFSLAIQTMVMAFVVLLTMSSIEETPQLYFGLTIVSNIVLNAAGGIYGSSLLGSTGVMPMKYTNALMLGFCTTKAMIVLSNIIFEVIKLRTKVMVFIYLSSSIAILFICILMEISEKSNKFRVYFKELIETEDKDTEGNRYLYVFTQISEQLLDLFLIVFVSYSIYSGIFTTVVLSDKVNRMESDVLFYYLLYHLSNIVGITTANFIHYPTPESMIAFSSARLLLIPIFLLFDNYQPIGIERKLPVLFKSGLSYGVFNIILGTTNGHMVTLTLMYTSKQVRVELATIAAMISCFGLAFPILFGFYFSIVLKNIV